MIHIKLEVKSLVNCHTKLSVTNLPAYHYMNEFLSTKHYVASLNGQCSVIGI